MFAPHNCDLYHQRYIGVIQHNKRILPAHFKLKTRTAISQEELADRAEINRNYIGMIERSENSASVDILEKLADALKVKPKILLDDT
ncbi:MAG: helix-turn-helix transcriptional regulator [Gammaproteobacteria bacterium]|nr:helix-turn-helix transcriptional regulator [Gammaproteobacteria bacterium]